LADAILVTGANGFLGANLVRRLLDDGLRVVAHVQPSANMWRLTGVLADVELIRAQLLDETPVPAVDAVVHLAAAGVIGQVDDRTVLEANVLGAHGAVRLAERAHAARLLYCGSCFEYGPGDGHREADAVRPISAYGASKAAGWIVVQAAGRQRGLSVVGVRPFTVYGPYEAVQRLVPSTCLSLVRNEAIRITPGTQRRDFVFVDDAVAAIQAVLSSSAEGETFNLCSGTSFAVREVAERLVELHGGSTPLLTGALPARATEFGRLSGDPSKMQAVVGWSASTDLEIGLRRTLAWFEDNEQLYPPVNMEAAV
jgi:nucleoside-diphosphate-sugar epimerase